MPKLDENFASWLTGLTEFDSIPVAHVQAPDLPESDDAVVVALNIPEPVDANLDGLGDDDCPDTVQATVTLFGRSHPRLRSLTRTLQDELKTIIGGSIDTTDIVDVMTTSHIYAMESTRDDRVEYSRLTMIIQYTET